MLLKSLELTNFRKFRETLRIDAFVPGFNIVVEPNETGKSTLLEALHAAFFIRHSAKTELVRSYIPIGDDVAPRVQVAFEIDGQDWTLEKQFMRSAYVRLSGPPGRKESDAAEDALQELLGFERGNNRGSDSETRGPLGMLWVEQATALSVDAPNRLVRDTVRNVLEAEVGAVTGGRRFDAIREQVEAAYTALRTGRTRQPRGDLALAEARLVEASQSRHAAEATLRDYNQALTELESTRARLKIIERDLADPELAGQRKGLEADLKTGEMATVRLLAAEAQHGQAEELAKAAASRIDRLDAAENRARNATAGLAEKQQAWEEAKLAVDAAAAGEKDARGIVERRQTTVEAAEASLSEARHRSRKFAEGAGSKRAIEAKDALTALEEREKAFQAEADAGLSQDDLQSIADLERTVLEARVRLDAGVVKVDIDLAEGVVLEVDGVTSGTTSLDIVTPTKLSIGSAGSVAVTPPLGSGPSMKADLAVGIDQLKVRLRALGVQSHADALARSERASLAKRELESIRTQISAACPGDPTIGLQPGADALRAFVAELGELEDVSAPTDDFNLLEEALAAAKAESATAQGRHDVARETLSKAEAQLASAFSEFKGIKRERDASAEHRDEVLKSGDGATLATEHAEALRERTKRFEAMETAREGAKSYDVHAIARRLENMTRAASRAGEERLELSRRIAALEATTLKDGGLGPAGVAAAASEEEAAATATCERLRREADVLETLRSALQEAAAQASRTFLAPVTKRASRYIERLLPGCDVSFNEELGLTSVLRAGIDESCGDLSRGTQEQLAILTRLAFADLLLEDGAPISVILDDPLVYSDDARLETMTDILRDASDRMQVILLTCRSKAFRHVDANRIELR